MDSGLVEAITDSPRLPTLPAVALEILELVERPDTDIQALARVISSDAALSAKILRTVNSSYYAQSRSIASVDQAIVVLGLNSVRTLALSFTLVDSFQGDESGGFDYDGFWVQSLRSAVFARVLAAAVDPARREEAFLGALLHQLGVLAMSEVLGGTYQQLRSEHQSALPLVAAENARLGVSHPLVGEALATRWNLPQGIVMCLRHYVSPAEAPAQHQALVKLVAASEDAASVFRDATAASALQRFRRSCSEWFAIDDDTADELLERSDEDLGSMRTMFELRAAAGPSAAEVLSRANEALTRISLEASGEAERLARQNRLLAVDASTDTLTGIANRRHFDEFLEEQSQIATRYGTPLSLLMLDIDRFKKLNDTFGHQVGDTVIQTLGAYLGRAVRSSDLAARYGGEEFAVIMPQVDSDGAAQMAERLRAGIHELAFDAKIASPLRITVSIGVTQFDASRHLDVVALIAEADALLYRAKQMGRDRVLAGGRGAA